MKEPQRIVIAGGGRVGYRTAQAFADHGHYVTVIERDPDFADRVQGMERITVIQGDATDPEVLDRAISHDTDTVGALTSDGETNLAIVLAAERLVPDGTRLVARVNLDLPDGYHEEMAGIYLFGQSSVRAAVAAMGGHDIRTLDELTGVLEIHQLVVAQDAPVAGRHIEDAGLPDGCLVVSLLGGQKSAHGDTVLRAGQEYVVAVDEGALDATRAAFGQS